jgi:hypothetical protein
MDIEDDKIQCKYCKHGRISYTRIIGATIPEWYCGLAHSDEFCYGDNFEDDE